MRGDFGGSSVNDSFPSGFPRPLLSGSSRCGSVSCRRRSPRRASPLVTFGALPAAKAAAPSRGPEDGHESDRSPATWHPRRRHRVPPGVKYRPSTIAEGLVAAGAYEAIKEASVISTGSAACPPCWQRKLALSSATRQSPGCCDSWPSTASRCSSGIAWHWRRSSRCCSVQGC
jgi:hypothetical protein